MVGARTEAMLLLAKGATTDTGKANGKVFLRALREVMTLDFRLPASRILRGKKHSCFKI